MTWQYVGGFFDGEGNVFPVPYRGTIRRIEISFYQASPGLNALEEIHKFLTRQKLAAYIRKEGRAGEGVRKYDYYRMVIRTNDDALKFLTLIEPHVIVKKEQVRSALKTLRYNERMKQRHGVRWRLVVAERT